MNRRKPQSCSESVGSVPFSWEERPGISKFSPCRQKKTQPGGATSTFIQQQPLQKSCSPHFQSPLNMNVMGSYDNFDMKITPPPRMVRPQSRSPSTKGLWGRRQDDDPFAAAIKECTKNVTSLGDPSIIKKYIGSIKNRNQSIILSSCKRSCDVKQGNLVRLVDLPPHPSPRGSRK